LGRFLSTDPVEPNTQTGMNFNRYAYADNNPYSKHDPNGRWVCSGSDEDCGAFEQGLDIVKDAASSSRLSGDEQSALEAVDDFYGEKGDDSVHVALSSQPGFSGGTENVRTDGGEDVSINLQPGLAQNIVAAHIAHEGQHGVDDQIRSREIQSRGERMATEINAYTTQAIFQKAINFVAPGIEGWTPVRGLDTKAIEEQARTSLNIACGSSNTGSCGE
jgi:hypothetical protein